MKTASTNQQENENVDSDNNDARWATGFWKLKCSYQCRRIPDIASMRKCRTSYFRNSKWNGEGNKVRLCVSKVGVGYQPTNRGMNMSKAQHTPEGFFKEHAKWLSANWSMTPEGREYADKFNAAISETAAERDKLREVNKELREALEAMLTEFNEQLRGVVHDELAAIAKARAAIAKAKGE